MDYEMVDRARALRIERGEEEHPAIENLEKYVRLLDDLIRIPILNIRIGLDPILGLIPWAGDTVTAAFSIYLIGSAVFYGLPKIVILRMALNVAFDYLVGLIPVVGDVTDIFIKSNRWNMNLLRRYAREHARPGILDYLFVFGVVGVLIAMVAGGILLVFYSLRAAGRLW
ncbi:MAG: DUF4112 domain-containing protein [Blastocatellia bacterium]